MNDEFCSSCGRLEKECICNSKEFCLSYYVEDMKVCCFCGSLGKEILNAGAVREFIRLLKEEFKEGVNVHNVLNKIDKLAGSALI